MGTDIHLYVEEKLSDERGWYPLTTSELFVWRDYDIFSRLCGVRERNPWRGITKTPRGLPDDVSLDIKNQLWESSDIHSISWISDHEFIREFSSEIANNGDFNSIPHFTLVCVPYVWKSLRPVRFVFGFDC